MAGSLTVTPAELAAAGSVLGRDAGPLSSAASAVQGSSGAAEGTPAAGAYAALLSSAAKSLPTIETAVSGLGRGLTQAATNYEQADAASCIAPGPGAR